MNKIKMVRNIKDIQKRDVVREAGWNNRFTIKEKSIIAPTQSSSILKPKNLRKSSSKPKVLAQIKVQSRTKSASKNTSQSNITHPLPDPLKTDPLYQQIKSLWESLGVTLSFRSIFNNVSVQLVQIYRDGYFNYEINQLTSIFNKVSKINKDIDSREKIIELLKKYDEYILLEEAKDKQIENDVKLINDIKKSLGDLRKISLSLVSSYVSLRKEIAYDVFMGKHDIDKILGFRSKYLLQMKNDTDFLVTTSLSKLFSFANESDPFLTAIANSSSKAKYYIPLESSLEESIKEAQYVMLQEMIYNECSKIKGDSSSIHSIKSIKSSKKINKSSYDIESFLNDYNKYSAKKELKPIKNVKPIDFKGRPYTALSKTPKKTRARIEDSKSGEKKNYSTHSNIVNHDMMKSVKKDNFKKDSEFLGDSDLLKIDEIINRSIKQKIQIDKEMAKIKNSNNEEINKYTQGYKEEHKQDKQDLENKYKASPKNELKENQEKGYFDDDDVPDENEGNAMLINERKRDLESKKEKEKGSNCSSIAKEEKEKEKDEKVKNSLEEFNFIIYQGDVKDLDKTYGEYFPTIPNDQVVSFNISSSILTYVTGIYPAIILVKSPITNELKGFVTINYSSHNQAGKSLQITSISSKSVDEFSSILKSFMSFINQTNYEYDEICIEYYYGVKDGQFYMVKELEAIIKTVGKFKWVNMENDGVHRKIKYKYKSTSLTQSASPFLGDNEQKGLNALQLNSLSISSFAQMEEYDMNNNHDKFDENNDFNMICIIIEMLMRYGYSLTLKDKEETQGESLEKFISGLNKEKFRKLTKEIVLTNFGFPEEVKDFVKENTKGDIFKKISSQISSELFIGSSIMSQETSFDNIYSTVLNGYEYNLIVNNIEVFEISDISEDNNKFFLLHPTNENMTLLIHEFSSNDSKISSLLSESDRNIAMDITESFKKIYMKIDQQPTCVKKRIFLPSFKIENNNTYTKPLSYKNFLFVNESNNYMINYLNQIENFNFGFCENKGKLLFEVDEETDVVIKNNFLISIINPDLLCDLQIPTVSAFVVPSEKWIKNI